MQWGCSCPSTAPGQWCVSAAFTGMGLLPTLSSSLGKQNIIDIFIRGYCLFTGRSSVGTGVEYRTVRHGVEFVV